MDKEGKILLVEAVSEACGQLNEALKSLNITNEVVCFSDTATGAAYLNAHYNDVFLVLQNVASPGLQLPGSRNMVFMHEKFNIPEVAYMFLVHPEHDANARPHTFLHTYYRNSDMESLKKAFSGIIEYWKAQIYPKPVQYGH